MVFPTREQVEKVRAEYPKGTRVELVSMEDPYSRLKPGDRGMVDHVDDTGTVFVRWESGSGLGIVYGEDRIRIVENDLKKEGYFHEGRLYQETGRICRRCGHPVYQSDNPEYSYQCFVCDEDLYTFETEVADT